MKKYKWLEVGGWISGGLLIVFGAVAIFMGANGIHTVREELAREQIVGTPDSDIPGQLVDSGSEAREFATVMRKHALEATQGLTYSQLGRYLNDDGKPTNDVLEAARNDEGRPIENPLRQLWVTETALATALNTAFMAENLGLFGIVVGVALMLTGIGFIILTWKGALRYQQMTTMQTAGVPPPAP